MRKWEDILAGYLEGTESRADAEALRMRIHLPVEDRAEVETMLRLADVVSLVLGSQLAPKDAIPMLVKALKDAPARPVPPQWRHEEGDFLSDTSNAESEETLNRRIEGAAVDASPADQLDEIEAIKADLANEEPPAGAVDRLLARMDSAAAGASDQIDEEDADRILTRIKGGERTRLWQPMRRPDVLAASADVEPPEEARETDKPTLNEDDENLDKED